MRFTTGRKCRKARAIVTVGFLGFPDFDWHLSFLFVVNMRTDKSDFGKERCGETVVRLLTLGC